MKKNCVQVLKKYIAGFEGNVNWRKYLRKTRRNDLSTHSTATRLVMMSNSLRGNTEQINTGDGVHLKYEVNDKEQYDYFKYTYQTKA